MESSPKSIISPEMKTENTNKVKKKKNQDVLLMDVVRN